MSRVVVMGGSRGIGLETVKALLERGDDVIAFSRGANIMQLDHPKLTRISGNAKNADETRAALKDANAVVQTLGVPVNLKLLTGPIDLFSSATLTLIPIMEELKINRLIAVTGFGAGDSMAAINCFQKVPFNIVFGQAYRDKSAQEALIKDSTLDWTIVRPGVLTNQRLKRPYRVRIQPKEWRNGIISRAAIADYIVSAIYDPATIGAEPVIAN